MLKKGFIAVLLLLALFSVNIGQTIVTAQQSECVIPPSGPWPPCATGGEAVPVPADPTCVIPPSGPWPPCATGGTLPETSNPDCVIPPSGPWPPCATGGTTPDLTPVPEETPMPDDEETPMPEETAEPTPEGDATPEPTEEPEMTPEPEDSVDVPEGEFTVTALDFSNITSREVTLSFSYANMPQDGYRPLFRVVDIDNCLNQCGNGNLLAEYPIIGNGGIDNPPENGDYSMPVAIDNIFCNQTHTTTRLILVMADLQMLRDTGSAPIDYVLEMPFDHTWCAD